MSSSLTPCFPTMLYKTPLSSDKYCLAELFCYSKFSPVWTQPFSLFLYPKLQLYSTIWTFQVYISFPTFYALLTSWEIDGETVEAVSDFISGVSKITADGDCSHEIKRCLLLGRKVMINLEHIEKQKQYFANKGLSSQGYGFSSSHVWM